MNPIDNNSVSFRAIRKPNLAKIITAMTKADALAPIVALEATVTGGRTIQAHKRGGKEESRERLIEETTGAIVWLWGVKVLNEVGDTILGKYLKTKHSNFDVGTDKVLRKPFENFMKSEAKGISPAKVAALKGGKVILSVLIANLVVGFVVPRINHYITNTIRHDKREKELAAMQSQDVSEINNNLDSDNTANTAFKGGGFAALNAFTNAIENTHTGQLLSTDIGVAGGRMFNARTKEERNEIAVRDLGSIYFYMWARGHISNIMNLVESGRATRLNPTTANILDHYLQELTAAKGGEMSVEEFKELVLGKNAGEIKLPEGITFEKGKLSLFSKFTNLFSKTKKEPLQVAKISDLEKLIKDEELMQRIKEMATLQPVRDGEAVVTKQQIIDAVNKAEINNVELLRNAFEEFSGGKAKEIGKNTKGKPIYSDFEYVDGASSNPYKFISNKKLYNLKSQMEDYVKDVIKAAKNGTVNKNLLDKVKRKNIMFSGLNFVTGFLIAAAFLSTIIPKIQYYMTQRRTGLNVFPGTYDYEHHREMIV